jgi:hypothetical protein
MHNNPDFFSVGGYDGMHVIYEVRRSRRRLAVIAKALRG